MLSAGSFGETRSVKWQFGRDDLETKLDPSTALWARPLVDAFAAPGTDLFVLNGLALPCGTQVAGHYDDTVFAHRTGVKVSVLYLALPPDGTWTGGELFAWDDASAIGGAQPQPDGGHGKGPGSPQCHAVPAVGTSVHFRGDLFHGISQLKCAPVHLEDREVSIGRSGTEPLIIEPLGRERVSVVLEQYSMLRFPLAVAVDTPNGPTMLHFGRSSDLFAVARAFVREHQLSSGAGCNNNEDCVAELILPMMKEQLDVRERAEKNIFLELASV
jgi:hypothetical protein